MLRTRTICQVLLAVLAAAPLTSTPGFGNEPGTTLERLSLDRRFRANGRTLARLGFDVVDHIRIVDDGIVVAGGKQIQGEFQTGQVAYAPLIARLLPSGRVDRTFGKHGVVQLAPLGRITGLAVGRRSTGRSTIVATGRFTDSGFREFSAVRLLASGALDAIFFTTPETAGKWMFPSVDLTTGAMTVVEQDFLHFRILRFTAAGALDATYGNGGIVDMDGYDPSEMVVDGAGRAIVARSVIRLEAADPEVYEVVRFAADGSRDLAFGDGGILRGPGGGAILAFELRLDGSGRIVVIAREVDGGGGYFRFLADGTLDTSFSDDGFAEEPNGLPGDVSVARAAFDVSPGDGAYVSSGEVSFQGRNLSREIASGFHFQSAHPDNLASVRTFLVRDPRSIQRARHVFTSGAVSHDGATALAGGYVVLSSGGHERTVPVLVRADLTRSVPAPLPDVRVLRVEAADELVNGQRRIAITVDIANDGQAGWANGYARLILSDDDVVDPSDLDFGYEVTGPLPRGRTTRVEFLPYSPLGEFESPAGKRILVELNPGGHVIEAGGPNAIVASPPIE